MKRKLKEIFSYSVRVCLFIALTRFDELIFLFTFLVPTIDFIFGGDGGFLTVLVLVYVDIYVLAKFCGLFKKLDNLNFFASFAVIVIIDILLSISNAAKIQIFPLKFSFSNFDYISYIIPCFILYKIFHLLGKKFPSTFGKIGYYSSIEFYKNLYAKFRKDKNIKNI